MSLLSNLLGQENHTWGLVPFPLERQDIGSQWVYRVKFKNNGEIYKYKSRLIVKRYTQMEVQNYHDTFSHVTKMDIVRTIISVTTSKSWYLI